MPKLVEPQQPKQPTGTAKTASGGVKPPMLPAATAGYDYSPDLTGVDTTYLVAELIRRGYRTKLVSPADLAKIPKKPEPVATNPKPVAKSVPPNKIGAQPTKMPLHKVPPKPLKISRKT